MGIDKQSDIAANIQIGPTDQGMVRIYIEAEGGIDLPLDFDPEEALEIAEELRAAAEAARAQGARPRTRKKALGPDRRDQISLKKFAKLFEKSCPPHVRLSVPPHPGRENPATVPPHGGRISAP